MSLSSHINEKANLIWAIADKLTGVYKPHEYGEVILPLTVIRRFDCILSDTKDAVLAKYEHVKELPMIERVANIRLEKMTFVCHVSRLARDGKSSTQLPQEAIPLG